MAFSYFLKKASSMFGLNIGATKAEHIDGEIIYCKNNVCVHPPASLANGNEHNPGYLTVRAQKDEVLGSTLILHWIPNSSLKRNPRSVENSPVPNSLNHRRQAREEYARIGQAFLTSEELCLANNSLTSSKNELSKIVYDNAEESSANFLNSVGCDVNALNECESVDKKVNGHKNHVHKRISNRSVTSIEMVGDNITVVSEELEDNAFISCSSSLTPDSISSGISNADSGLGKTANIDMTDVLVINLLNSSATESSSENRMASQINEKHTIDALYKEVEEQCFDQDEVKENRFVELSSLDSECSSVTTSGPDSHFPSPISFSPVHDNIEIHHCELTDTPSIQSSSGITMTYNLTFPENSVSFGSNTSNATSARDQLCGVFSVDLGQMRSVRVFFSDDACTSGQLVIASRESQYKVLHFHSGGLDKFVEELSEWKFLIQQNDSTSSELDIHCRHFSVVRPNLSDKLSHPEENTYEPVNETTWRQHMNEKGFIEDEQLLCKAIFFAGLDKSLRHEMWPFLLCYYPYNSTFEQREQIRNDKYLEYQNIRKLRENMSEEEKEHFWRNVEYIVEKDVVRTDRSHEYFRGDHNPNLAVLRDILLNYAAAHPEHGYTQGMSDLLAPLLIEIQNEVDTYWCFVGLMLRTIFVSSPTDIDMDKQLLYLRELLRLMVPKFYNHLKTVDENMDLLFVHRWILLCFKREFCESDALHMWEACWAHYQTDYFHLFICLAIIALYGEEVVVQALPADEMLLHFSSLAMHMNARFVLSKARCLLHQFRTLPTIPCTLDGLCSLCAPGMWDSGHVPAVQCVGGHGDNICPSSTDSPS